MASDRVVLNGYDVFSILVVSTEKRYLLQFFEKGFRFPEICFKVKILKTFETFTDCHIKTCRPPISTEGYFENPKYRFLEEPMFFLLALKWNSKKKRFWILRQKPIWVRDLQFPSWKIDTRENIFACLLSVQNII